MEDKTMAWTQKELEELYSKVNEKGSTDPEFRQRLLKEPVSAIEELAGRPLPEGYRLECIANDNSYSGTYVIPDFAQGEIDFNELRSVAGGSRVEREADIGPSGSNDDRPAGLSVAAIVSVCAAAASVGPCPADACGANAGCAGDACGAAACGAAGSCMAEACGGEACGAAGGCAANACGGEACGGDVGCAWAACAADACAANIGCVSNVCGGDACAAHGGCAIHGGGGGACAADGGCFGAACGADVCAAVAKCTAYGAKVSAAASGAPSGYDPFGQTIAGAAAGQFFGKSQGAAASSPAAPASSEPSAPAGGHKIGE